MLTTPGTDAQCNIFEGDALRVVRQDEKLDEEGKTQLTLIMKVEKANPNKKFGCTIGDEVSADLAQVVEMENAFQLKVEQSLAKMEKEKQGK